MTSPGLIAVPEGRFSVAGIRPTTLIFGFRRPSTSNAPSTAVAPGLSNFMSSMFAGGLIEIPPQSNRAPFSHNTTGGPVPPRLSPTKKHRFPALDRKRGVVGKKGGLGGG